ncbi:hypothetical protein ACJ7RV_002623 [Vibrio parahaemolyticus]
MKIPKEDFEDARIELSALGFKASLRRLCLKMEWDEYEAIYYLSHTTKSIDEVFIRAKKFGLPDYMVNGVIDALSKKGLIYYRHQLRPTREIIENHALMKIYQRKC